MGILRRVRELIVKRADQAESREQIVQREESRSCREQWADHAQILEQIDLAESTSIQMTMV